MWGGHSRQREQQESSVEVRWVGWLRKAAGVGVGVRGADNLECNLRPQAAWLVSGPVPNEKERLLQICPFGE